MESLLIKRPLKRGRLLVSRFHPRFSVSRRRRIIVSLEYLPCY